MRVLDLAICGLLFAAASERAYSQNLLPVHWTGGDGEIDREIAFRTSELNDWVTFWQAQFPERAVPLIDFFRFEAVGLVLRETDVPFTVAFDGAYEATADSIVLTFRYNHAVLLTPTRMSGSRYALAAIPKTDKKVLFRAMVDQVTREFLKERTLEARPLQDQDANHLPLIPLQLTGGGSYGGGNRQIEVFGGEPSIVNQGDEGYRIAHVMVRLDPEVRITSLSSDGDGDKYSRVKRWTFGTATGEVLVMVRVDGRQQVVEAAGQTFDLRKGNYIRVDIRPNGRAIAVQIPVVEVRPKWGDDDEIARVFEEHGARGGE